MNEIEFTGFNAEDQTISYQMNGNISTGGDAEWHNRKHVYQLLHPLNATERIRRFTPVATFNINENVDGLMRKVACNLFIELSNAALFVIIVDDVNNQLQLIN